jgi:hypothetical protein
MIIAAMTLCDLHVSPCNRQEHFRGDPYRYIDPVVTCVQHEFRVLDAREDSVQRIRSAASIMRGK